VTENKEKDWTDNLNHIDEPSDDKFSFLEFLWDLFKTAVIVVAVAFGIKYFLVQPFIVDGNSMQPNFDNNEYLLVEKITPKMQSLKRGDVIVFHPPGQEDTNYIKRIIGLPNEKVEIVDNKVKIFNQSHPTGVVLEEAYIASNTKTAGEKADETYTLTNDEYFVLGDNREHSSDSREFGPLPKGNLIGRAWVNVYPFNKFGVIKRQVFVE
jgi:signal peptidase I